MRNFELEFNSVNNHTRSLLEEYVYWGAKIEVADTQQWMYNELIDFVNFRMETASTCLFLSESNRIADSFGLCRSLLENYLLFILMCRGHKWFQVRDCSNLTEGKFKQLLAEESVRVPRAHAAGESRYTSVMKHPKLTRRLMYILDGISGGDDPGFMVPAHYFQFQEFRPDAMRLPADAYFEYHDFSQEVRASRKEYQAEMSTVYREFLSYDALLRCLELNGLTSSGATGRIEAHYVFLGSFLHPTHEAARKLHEKSNHYDGQPAIGLKHPYRAEVRLLSALYICFLTAGILDEIVRVHENAPSKYIKSSGSAEIRKLIQEVPRRYNYFWFISNAPAPFDKYRHFGYSSTVEERERWGDWTAVPDDAPKFNKEILDQLAESFSFLQAGH
ncbi:hypothetical protein [Nocardia sp. NPDC050412]|uniref:hypothetical protein n=1 Tax=Nocardia sp. NPDC050412 TaxID=3364320 RepID=UPI003794F6ED